MPDVFPAIGQLFAEGSELSKVKNIRSLIHHLEIGTFSPRRGLQIRWKLVITSVQSGKVRFLVSSVFATRWGIRAEPYECDVEISYWRICLAHVPYKIIRANEQLV